MSKTNSGSGLIMSTIIAMLNITNCQLNKQYTVSYYW